MLKQNHIDSFPTISVFKMNSGEEFICKVVDDNVTHWIVEKPLSMVSTDKGLQFAPFLMMANMNEKVYIPKPCIMAKPDAKLQDHYESTISPIVVPQKSSIVTGR